MPATGFLTDERYLRHDTGPGHPERPERLSHTLQHLEAQPWFGALTRVAPRAAEIEWIAKVHDLEYIERARAACRSGEGELDTPDVPVSRGSYEAALLAVGGALELCDRIVSGTIQNGFALLRPPGHHAETSRAMGFCLFNNAAIAARYLQERHGLERVLTLDWDVHHGNGTQHAFEEDPSVLYVSTHQYPFYPGTGAHWETGEGSGKGATLNCPMRAGSTDVDYEVVFKDKIEPKVEAFRPDAIIVSAGFDAHEKDPLGQICLTTPMYGWMTRRVTDWAARYSRGRVLSLLEGGYDLTALAECVGVHMETLVGVDDRLSTLSGA